ncbi:MAG: DUF892 family protein, partial [Actinomycetota bacterium]|nr:DUF892 family protein [Actinomycetota bacterium]
MNDQQVDELLYQALETELGGVKVYETVIRCAVNDDFREEMKTYLDETRQHVDIVKGIFSELDMDTERETPGRMVVRHKGEGLVAAMEMALAGDTAAAAQLVAAECVVEAETKDHANWELIGAVASSLKGERARVLQEAYDQVGEQEDHHLY